MSLATALTDQQLQLLSLSLSAGFDLQPQLEFQLRKAFSHVVLHGFDPVAPVTQSEP